MTKRDELVVWVRGQLGKPYGWGEAGPDAFDCSGLVQDAYRMVAGVDIGRDTAAQQSTGAEIPASEARPGDLVFFGDLSGAHAHVGMVVGADTMIDAPHTDGVVREDHISAWAGSGEPLRQYRSYLPADGAGVDDLDPLEATMSLAKDPHDAAEYEVRKWYAQFGNRDPDQGGLDAHVANVLANGLAKGFTGFLDSPEIQAVLTKERQAG